MFVAKILLGGLAGWALVGVILGVAAAFSKRVSISAGILGGFVLGPLALVMFYSEGRRRVQLDPASAILIQPPSRYHRQRCPECTGPNDFLTWRGSSARSEGLWGDLAAPQTLYLHAYKCTRCDYEWRFESPDPDPDNPRHRIY